MKWYNQRGIRCIAAHAFERKGNLALPGDPVLAGFEGPAESRDEIVGCVRTSENRPPAEVQAHDVGRYFGVVRLGDDAAPEAHLFQPGQERPIKRQRTYSMIKCLVDPAIDSLVKDGVDFPALYGAEALGGLGNAAV